MKTSPYETPEQIAADLFARYPGLTVCREALFDAFALLSDTFRAGGKVLVCGNGGSAADAEHIVGELLKSFMRKRAIPREVAARLQAQGAEGGALVDKLEGALGAVSLVSMSGLVTAFANDVAWETAYAQQTLGLMRPGDVLWALSTSGRAANCVAAARVARAVGGRVLAFTGQADSPLSALSDVALRVPQQETFKVQEFHLPLYHALCAMLEAAFFAA